MNRTWMTLLMIWEMRMRWIYKYDHLRNIIFYSKVFFLFQEDITQSKFEKFKYFTSLILGTVCIVCIFAFLFLVPFVLDPAVSTLLHRFVDQPVTCKVTQVDIRHGSKDTNCKWSSCREGCTADIFVCYQVRIALHYEILEIAHVPSWNTSIIFQSLCLHSRIGQYSRSYKTAKSQTS